MPNKMVSLAGEVHITSGSIYTIVDAMEALKCIGLAYGLYSRAEDSRDQRVRLEDGDHPALVVQEDISRHGSPLWKTVCTITDDPKQINRYLTFRETLKIIRQMEAERSVQEEPPQAVKKGGKFYER